ncbi:MAG: putative ABC transporter permease [Lachnospiraceae bacterium]|nr:putative ABC transporter permease [Lachnospiraceae bacterium]
MFVGLDFHGLIIAMMLYSFIGWAYESTIYSLFEDGKFRNRGYFIGPYCPIYSVVSIVNVFLLQGITDPFRIVFFSALVCTLVEFVTSYVLEKLFNARYWDYSAYPLNINGRVSLPSSLFFGFAVLLLVKVIHPFTVVAVNAVPFTIRMYVAIFFLALFLSDLLVTTLGMINLNKKCKQFYDYMDHVMDRGFDKANAKREYLAKFAIVEYGVEKSRHVMVTVKDISQKFIELETNIIKRRPDFHSMKYNEMFEVIRHNTSSEYRQEKKEQKRQRKAEKKRLRMGNDFEEPENLEPVVMEYPSERLKDVE